jgi:hypothetical protein
MTVVGGGASGGYQSASRALCTLRLLRIIRACVVWMAQKGICTRCGREKGAATT